MIFKCVCQQTAG